MCHREHGEGLAWCARYAKHCRGCCIYVSLMYDCSRGARIQYFSSQPSCRLCWCAADCCHRHHLLLCFNCICTASDSVAAWGLLRKIITTDGTILIVQLDMSLANTGVYSSIILSKVEGHVCLQVAFVEKIAVPLHKIKRVKDLCLSKSCQLILERTELISISHTTTAKGLIRCAIII